MSRWSVELVIDPIACDGRGVCAEILPERIELDRWGYPIVDGAEIAPALFEHAEPRRPGVSEAGAAPGGAGMLSPPLDDLDLEPPQERDCALADRSTMVEGPGAPPATPHPGGHRGRILAIFLIWLAVSSAVR